MSYSIIWGHPPPPKQASVGELYLHEVERDKGEPFRRGKGRTRDPNTE
jgi:hypothetical protein